MELLVVIKVSHRIFFPLPTFLRIPTPTFVYIELQIFLPDFQPIHAVNSHTLILQNTLQVPFLSTLNQ